MRPAAVLLAAACLCVAITACAAEQGGGQLTPIPGRPAAPAFDLADPQGKRVRLADFRGKPLIVNFWATWCPPCRAEMPSLQRAFEQLEPEGIGVIAINVGEEKEAIEPFIFEADLTFPLPMDLDNQVSHAWPVRGLPTTFVLDPAGRLVYAATGEREWDDPALLDLVRALKQDTD